MTEQPTPVPRVWRVDVGRTAVDTRVFLDGAPLYPCGLQLVIQVGQPTMLELQWPMYGMHGWVNTIPPTFHRRDTLIISTRHQAHLTGDPDDGLFGTR